MIIPFNSNFLTPAKNLRRMSVLLAIHNDSKLSQHQIGKITHLSSSMVNNYIKTFHSEDLVKVIGKTNRTQTYHLTSRGRNELTSLLLTYSAEIIQLYGATKREVAEKLYSLNKNGIENIVLFGAAETAEVVYTAAKDTPLKIKGIVDSDPEKQGTSFNGFTIKAPEDLKSLKPEAVVITSFARQEEIHKSIKKIIGSKIIIKKLSDL